MLSTPLRLATALACAAAIVTPALAHHVMDGQLPATFWQGLLSGLGHPIIGLDHLAFIVGVGVMSRLAGQALTLPIAFVLGTLIGAALHLRAIDLPAGEIVIALTVAAIAVAVALRLRVPQGLLALAFTAAGIFHGHAYAESIVGAEASPLAAYLIGFSVIQVAIAVAAGWAIEQLGERAPLTPALASRVAGGLIGAVAVVFLAGAVAS